MQMRMICNRIFNYCNFSGWTMAKTMILLIIIVESGRCELDLDVLLSH